MYIKPNSNAKDGSLFLVYPGAEEFLLIPKSDDVPCPWDADVSISGGRVILEGSMAPGGPGDMSTCICNLPVSAFSKYFYLEVPEYVVDENPGILEALENAGWSVYEDVK